MAGCVVTSDFLDRMTRTADPIADETVQAIYEAHEVPAVNALLQRLIETGEVSTPPGLSALVDEKLRRYLEQTREPPEWADREKIALGEQIFCDYGPSVFSFLACASLPESYAWGKGGTQVLGATQQLVNHVHRRIPETAQFVVDVMSSGGLTHQGNGVAAAQRVRLMHAAIRFLLKQPADRRPAVELPAGPPETLGEVFLRIEWDTKWGEPVNQELLEATLLTFSYVILRSLRELDVWLSPEQEEAYIHCWNVVGYFLGIDERFLLGVVTYDQAEALFTQIVQRKQMASQEGRNLTEALLGFMDRMIGRRGWIGHLHPLRRLPRVLLLRLVKPEISAVLGVCADWRDRLGEAALRFFRPVVALVERGLAATHWLAHWLYAAMVKEWKKLERGGRRKPFDLPESLPPQATRAAEDRPAARPRAEQR